MSAISTRLKRFREYVVKNKLCPPVALTELLHNPQYDTFVNKDPSCGYCPKGQGDSAIGILVDSEMAL
jgi:hypothetical protein